MRTGKAGSSGLRSEIISGFRELKPEINIAGRRSSCMAPNMLNDGAATDLATHGALRFHGAALPCMDRLTAALFRVPLDEAGVRLHGITGLEFLLSDDGCIGALAASVLGKYSRPVRAILFNKSANTNWSLAWHQNRTICVRERRDAPGFGPWTVKGGMNHVAPPFDLLSRMVTLRVHLDDVPVTNAPLLIAPGSHTLGRIAVGEVPDVVRRCGIVACLAKAGDVWLYATPILHASEAASLPKSRRVLQVDFAAQELPHGLEWLGV